MTPTSQQSFDSPLGRLNLAARGGKLARIVINPPSPQLNIESTADADDQQVLERTAKQLEAYFAGRCATFDLPLESSGTAFQRAVWQALRLIPWGATTSYSALATSLGRPGAARAVGMANHRNPWPIVVPCHRVIGANGQLTGYAGGLHCKALLLELERSAVTPPAFEP